MCSSDLLVYMADERPVVAVVRGDQVLPGAEAGPLEAGDEVLAVTTLAAEPEVRRLLGGQPGGSHTPG